jgi:hypothetical protein
MKRLRENRNELTSGTNADILSDMKTFTVRDLDRSPGAVLDACEREGVVQIRRRNGHTYTLKPNQPVPPKMTIKDWLVDLEQRRHLLCPKPLTRKQVREFDRKLSENRLL